MFLVPCVWRLTDEEKTANKRKKISCTQYRFCSRLPIALAPTVKQESLSPDDLGAGKKTRDLCITKVSLVIVVYRSVVFGQLVRQSVVQMAGRRRSWRRYSHVAR